MTVIQVLFKKYILFYSTENRKAGLEWDEGEPIVFSWTMPLRTVFGYSFLSKADYKCANNM